MSRSNITQELVNPCKYWFKWIGSTGELMYYDKEEKVNKTVQLPFAFLLLDILHTIKGYDKVNESGIWSNEIKDLQTQSLTVKTSDETIKHGLYADIKESVTARNGKYAQSLYIAFKKDNEYCIGNIAITGSSFGGGSYKNEEKKIVEVGAWLEFTKKTKKVDLYNKVIVMTKNNQVLVNGATKFYAPRFELRDITNSEVHQIAIELDKELQDYLTKYLDYNNKDKEIIPKEIENEIKENMQVQNIPQHETLYGQPKSLSDILDNDNKHQDNLQNKISSQENIDDDLPF